MIRIIEASAAAQSEMVTRDIKLETGVEQTVAGIIEEIRQGGDEALLAYTEKFDKVRPASLIVGAEEIDAAYAAQDPAYIDTLTAAAANIRAFHQMQAREGFRLEKEDGVVLGQKVTPIERRAYMYRGARPPIPPAC